MLHAFPLDLTWDSFSRLINQQLLKWTALRFVCLEKGAVSAALTKFCLSLSRLREHICLNEVGHGLLFGILADCTAVFIVHQ